VSLESVDYFVRAYRLALVPAGRGLRLVSRSHTLEHPPLAYALKQWREEIAAELQRRVVPLEVSTRTTPDRAADPWRHAHEGICRMAWARQKAQQWRAEGQSPVVRWEPCIAVLDERTKEPLEVPAWARPEILWVLRQRALISDQDMSRMDSRSKLTSPQTGAGIEFYRGPMVGTGMEESFNFERSPFSAQMRRSFEEALREFDTQHGRAVA
jgi:hypothetical protein